MAEALALAWLVFGFSVRYGLAKAEPTENMRRSGGTRRGGKRSNVERAIIEPTNKRRKRRKKRWNKKYFLFVSWDNFPLRLYWWGEYVFNGRPDRSFQMAQLAGLFLVFAFASVHFQVESKEVNAKPLESLHSNCASTLPPTLWLKLFLNLIFSETGFPLW